MDFQKITWNWFSVICQTVGKESRLINHLVPGLYYCKGCHRDLFWDISCSIFIYHSDLFYFLRCNVCNLYNFADYATPYVCGKNLLFILTKLEEHSIFVIEWFESDYMKMNPDKCNFFILGNKFEWLLAKIHNNRICEHRTVIYSHRKWIKILWTPKQCLSESKKELSTLIRIRKYLDFKKLRIHFKGRFEAQFKYCSLPCTF